MSETARKILGDHDWITAPEFAALLRVCRRTLLRHMKKGDIPRGEQIGNGRYRWPRRVVLEFLKIEDSAARPAVANVY